MHLSITPENIVTAQNFLRRKWIERSQEMNPRLAMDRPDLLPTDLSQASNYASLFAQALFGGALRGNPNHYYVISHDQRIDLTGDSRTTQSLGKKAYRHVVDHFANRFTQMSLDSCRDRVARWVEEFMSSRRTDEGVDIFHTPQVFKYSVDNPGGDWLGFKQRRAEKDAEEHKYTGGMSGYMTAGAVTAHMGIFAPMYMPTKILLGLRGVNQEELFRHPGEVKYDSLAQQVRDNGWNQKHAVMVRVNHQGLAYVMEGNTRIRIAAANHIPYVNVQFEWVNGGEHAPDDLWSPKRVAECCYTGDEVKKAEIITEDAEDHYKPRPMTKAKVLYRAVSIPELSDIRMRGRVLGGQNRFNEFEHRRWVFFGDKLNDELISQGEDTERQAIHKMSSHAILRAMKRLMDDRKEEALMVITQLEKAGLEPCDDYHGFYRPYVENFLEGYNSRWIMKFFWKLDDEGKIARANNSRRKMDEMTREIDELQDRYRNLIRAEHDLIKARLVPLKVSSAVIVTKPIKGGIHYSKSFGKSGMTQDEYGFESGQITLDDIDKILLVKKGQVIGEMTPEELETKLPDLLNKWEHEDL